MDEVLTHRPAHALRSREHNPGEHAYNDEWQKLVAAPVDDDADEEEARTGQLGRILCGFPVRLTDRHSRLAAAFAVWLGTNCGGSLVYTAKRGDQTFFQAWSNDNLRRGFVNGGFRASDFLTSEDWSKPSVCRDALEVEVFDFIAAWLDTADGKAFLRRAEARFLAYRHKVPDHDLKAIVEGFRDG